MYRQSKGRRKEEEEDRINLRNVFTEFPTNHLLCNLNLLICLAIVNSKAQSNKIGKNSRSALLRPNGWCVGGRRELSRQRETAYVFKLVDPIVYASLATSLVRQKGRKRLGLEKIKVIDAAMVERTEQYLGLKGWEVSARELFELVEA